MSLLYCYAGSLIVLCFQPPEYTPAPAPAPFIAPAPAVKEVKAPAADYSAAQEPIKSSTYGGIQQHATPVGMEQMSMDSGGTSKSGMFSWENGWNIVTSVRNAAMCPPAVNDGANVMNAMAGMAMMAGMAGQTQGFQSFQNMPNMPSLPDMVPAVIVCLHYLMFADVHLPGSWYA